MSASQTALANDKRLVARLLAARAVLWAEALAIALWPVAALLAGFAGLALLGTPARTGFGGVAPAVRHVA